jgi:hypothetical protein
MYTLINIEGIETERVIKIWSYMIWSNGTVMKGGDTCSSYWRKLPETHRSRHKLFMTWITHCNLIYLSMTCTLKNFQWSGTYFSFAI